MKHSDPYLERIQAQTDPIIRKAQERILRAARAVLEAREQLRFASVELERHPDYVRTERARRKGKTLLASLTPAWWLHQGIRSVMEETILEDAADWLFEDSNPRRLIASLRCFVDEEKRDLARFARRRSAKRKARPQDVAPAAPVLVAA